MMPDESNDQPRKILSLGDTAPEFELREAGGALVRSSQLLRQGPVLLTFYRGAWCPCCQSDFRDLEQAMPDIRRTGSTVLGVLHELSTEASESVKRRYSLEFPIVDDVYGYTAEAFGIRQSAGERSRIEEGLASSLREGEPWILPMQARFIIGARGLIARSEIIFDYNERSSVRDLIPTLAAIAPRMVGLTPR